MLILFKIKTISKCYNGKKEAGNKEEKTMKKKSVLEQNMKKLSIFINVVTIALFLQTLFLIINTSTNALMFLGENRVIAATIVIFSLLFFMKHKFLKGIRTVFKNQENELENEKREFEESFSKTLKPLAQSHTKLQTTFKQLDELIHTTLDIKSSKQASINQDAVAAMEEVFKVVKQTNESGQRCLDLVNTAQNKVVFGSEIIGQLMEVMNEIRQGCDDLFSIINLVDRITEKTKVMNSIVVKTELLSFNANEVAKAAEHGKGFTVVAQEVEKLANVSRELVKEMDFLLNQISFKVSEVVAPIQLKVDLGQKRTDECAAVLNDMKKLGQDLTQNVSSIFSATQEHLSITNDNSRPTQILKSQIDDFYLSMNQVRSILDDSNKNSFDFNADDLIFKHVHVKRPSSDGLFINQ